MSLEQKIKQILINFDNAKYDDVIEILTQIQFHLKNDITQDYLRKKIQMISDANSDSEKRKMCNNLKPYFDWYLQGI